jgi:hypothetical protein
MALLAWVNSINLEGPGSIAWQFDMFFNKLSTRFTAAHEARLSEDGFKTKCEE